MTTDFDPYHVWLGISPAEQPPHLYRLIGVSAFEGDCRVIEAAVDRQTQFVRSQASTTHPGASKAILQELEHARQTLLDLEAKSYYDSRLRIATSGPTSPPAASNPPPLPGQLTHAPMAQSATTAVLSRPARLATSPSVMSGERRLDSASRAVARPALQSSTRAVQTAGAPGSGVLNRPLSGRPPGRVAVARSRTGGWFITAAFVIVGGSVGIMSGLMLINALKIPVGIAPRDNGSAPPAGAAAPIANAASPTDPMTPTPAQSSSTPSSPTKPPATSPQATRPRPAVGGTQASPTGAFGRTPSGRER